MVASLLGDKSFKFYELKETADDKVTTVVIEEM
jgi:hypothetical protein